MFDVFGPIELQWFAVRTVVLEHTIGADIMQQTADDHQMLVDEPGRHLASDHIVGRRHHMLRLGVRIRCRRPATSGQFRGILRQRATPGEQRVLSASERTCDPSHDDAVAVDQIIGCVAGGDAMMQFVDLFESWDIASHTHHLRSLTVACRGFAFLDRTAFRCRESAIVRCDWRPRSSDRCRVPSNRPLRTDRSRMMPPRCRQHCSDRR